MGTTVNARFGRVRQACRSQNAVVCCGAVLLVAMFFGVPATADEAATIRAALECGQVPCPLEENCDCPVPGITDRWRAAYCMATEQTDDLEHGGVQRCLSRPEPRAVRTLTPCARNEYWKRMVCRATPGHADVERCVQDRAFIPSIVERGPGSPGR